MDNIQDNLNKISQTWGQVSTSVINRGNVKIIMIFKDNHLVGECCGINNASKITGCKREAIHKVLRFIQKTTNGYYFVWKEKWKGETSPDPNIVCKKPPHRKKYDNLNPINGRPKGSKDYGKPVLCFRNEEFVGEFLSYTLAAKELNLHKRSIYNCLRQHRGQKTHKGYSFKYK